jgi:hypothetical protein
LLGVYSNEGTNRDHHWLSYAVCGIGYDLQFIRGNGFGRLVAGDQPGEMADHPDGRFKSGDKPPDREGYHRDKRFSIDQAYGLGIGNCLLVAKYIVIKFRFSMGVWPAMPNERK